LDLRRKKWREAGEDWIKRNFIACTLHQMLLDYQIKEDAIGGACSTYGKDEKWISISVGEPDGQRPIAVDGKIKLH